MATRKTTKAKPKAKARTTRRAAPPPASAPRVLPPHEVLVTAFDFEKKDNLLALYTILQRLGVRSIGDLENKIARAE